MEFLNPAFLFGLAAASIPVIIHLLNLKKLQKIEFSTLVFLKELQKSKIRKIKIKQWLLLALRILIILFLVLAFSRPTLKGVAIGGTTSAAKTSVVFIIDNTISMSAVDENGSLLNQIKGVALKLTKLLQQGDEASIVLLGDANSDGVTFTSNLIELKKRITQVSHSDVRGDFQKALLSSAKLLEQSNNFNKEIYVLSDFQKNMLTSLNSNSNYKPYFSDNIRVYTFNYSGKNFSNLSIDKFESSSQIFEKDKPVNFSVVVTNHSGHDVEDEVVSLFLNKERSAQKSFSLEAGKSIELNIEATLKNTGFIDVEGQLEEDDINGDNIRYLNIYVPEKIPLIVFSADESETKYFKLALLSSGESNFNIDRGSLNQISSFDLNKYLAVILFGMPGEPDLQKLKSFVEKGGGLFIFPSAKEELQNFSSLISYFDFAGKVMTSGKINSMDNFFVFDKIELQHPLLQNIFEENSKKQIESPEVYFHYKFISSEKGKKIITLNDGSTFLSDYKIGAGKILLCNTSPVLEWSNFPLKSIFVPLVNKSVYYLASKDRELTNYLAGEEILIPLNSVSLAGIKIIKPDSQSEFLQIKAENQSGIINYSNTSSAGNYKIFSGDNLIETIAVNINQLESETQYADESSLKDFFTDLNFIGTFKNIEKGKNPVSLVLQSRYGSELWKYFLIAALIIALVEMLVARNTKKDLAGIEQ